MNKPQISVSLMCMDLLRVEEQLRVLDQYSDWYHMDIMDWHYVRNITLSPDFMKAVRRASNVPMDAHLMVDPVDMDLISLCIESGVNCVSVHPDTCAPRIYRIISELRRANVQFGVVLNPSTTLETVFPYLRQIDKITFMAVDPGFAGQSFIPDVLEKLRRCKRLRERENLHFVLEVDGGCNPATYRSILEAGCEQVIVGGSGLFRRNENLQEAAILLHKDLQEAVQ